MDKKIAKALLVVGLSFGLVNCGDEGAQSGRQKNFRYNDVNLERVELAAGVVLNSSEGHDEPVIAVMPELESVHSLSGYSKLVTVPVTIDTELGPSAVSEIGAYDDALKLRVLQKYDLVPVQNLIPNQEKVVIEDVSVVAVEETDEFVLPEWSDEIPVVGGGQGFAETEVTVESDDVFWKHADEAEGIYLLGAHLKNDETCNSEDARLLGGVTESYALVQRGKVNGAPVLNVVSCEGEADCRRKATRVANGEPVETDFAFMVTHLDSARVFHGSGVRAGQVNADGNCVGGAVIETSLSLVRGNLMVKQIETSVALEAVDCSAEASIVSAERIDCEAMSTLDAQWVSGL